MEEIKTKLNEYLGFDYMDLFTSSDYNDFIYIYGGCIRDIISNNKINDVDILCSTKAIRNHIIPILEKNGYKLCNRFGVDLVSSYSNIRAIFEPISYIKGDSIVQLIRPSTYNSDVKNSDSPEFIMNNILELLGNVDMSCCGLYINRDILYESVEGAYLDCSVKHYIVNKKATFYNDNRIYNRIAKMENKGFSDGSVLTEQETLIKKNIGVLMGNKAMRSPFIYTIIEPKSKNEYDFFWQ